MNIRPAIQIAGVINIIIALAMLAPLGVSIYYAEGDAWIFAESSVITGVSGALMLFVFRARDYDIRYREGFFIVVVSWFAASLDGAIPFMLSEHFLSFTDAIFESVSGITTTGGSILDNVEALPHGLLFWRSELHWIGGVGIVLLSLAILPLLGVGGMQLYNAESSAFAEDKFAPRIKEMSRIILAVYISFSIILVVLLKLLGMDLFDAVVHMFGTVSTGGFSSNGASIGGYSSFYIESVIIIFMILGATNFALHYRFSKEGFKVYTRNSEFKFYILLMTISSLLIALNLWGDYYSSFAQSLRHATFQVVSVVTTTGYGTSDFASWPPFGQLMILVLMFTGGCAGSTTGSIKCIRLYLLLKLTYKEFIKLIHPRAFVPVRLSGKVVPDDVMRGIQRFTILYLLVFIVSALGLNWMGVDFTTAISSAAASLSNVGPGLALTGPLASFSVIPEPGKWLLIFDMLLGRLEISSLLILLLPTFWSA